jgi:hypothetical protein
VKVKVLSEILSAKGVIPVGQIIEIETSLLAKLQNKVAKLDTDPKSFDHYCHAGDAWCSAKLPGRDYPQDCIRHNCEYWQGVQS